MASPYRPLIALLVAGLALPAQDADRREGYQPKDKPAPSTSKPEAREEGGHGKNEENLRDDAWGRREWWRTRMGGDLDGAFGVHLIQEATRERAKYPNRFAQGGGTLRPAAVNGSTWVNLGPTSSNFTQNGVQLNKVDSGRPRVILPDTADTTGNTVYILASGGGLWKTTNFLSATPTWNPLTDFVGSNMSGSAAFGRTTSILYVGAGDPFDSGVGGFMIRSANGGSSWSSAVALSGASSVLDIKVDTTQAQDIVLVGTNNGLYRSTDGGTSYNAVGSLTGKVWSIVKTSAGWLASTVASSGIGSLMISTDRGATWSPITNAGTVYTGAGRTTLGVGADGDAVVYAFAATQGDDAQKDLYRSTNGGQTWTALGINAKVPAHSNTDQTNMDLMAGQAFYNQMILVDPTDTNRNTVYLGGQLSTAKTTDGGGTWTLTSNWLPGGNAGTATLPYLHADCHCAAFSNFGGTPRLYVGSDGGLFTSTDGGTTWDDTKNKGLVNHLIYAMAANPGTTGSVLAGLQDNGTRLRVGTSSVFNQTYGGDGFGVAWSQANNAVSMGSYVANSIYRCTTNPPDDQSKWVDFILGLPSAGNQSTYYFVTPIITPPGTADASGQVFFTYSRTGIIYKSNSTGWTAIGTPGTGGITSGRIVRSVSHGIGVSPVDLQHVAAAGNGGYVLVTANGGTTWTETYLGSTGTDGQNIGWTGFNANAAWANNSILYVCSESTTAGAAHVARSADGGTTWARKDAGLPDVPVTKLAVDPGDATGNTVYAATWLGVYRTQDGGTNWSLFGTGLPQGRATDIWVAPDSSSIRVSTWGRGIWELASAGGAQISLSPNTVQQVDLNGAKSFTANVTNYTANRNANWTATAGSFNLTTTLGDGATATTFTAPGSPQVVTVTATSEENTSAKAMVTVNVYTPAALTVSVSPATKVLLSGGTQTFAATVSGAPTTAVTWGTTAGAVTSGGAFTAPTLTTGTQTITVTATSAFSGPTNSGSATVTVKSLDVNADATVDLKDLAFIANAWGSATPAAKLSDGTTVNDTDLQAFLANF